MLLSPARAPRGGHESPLNLMLVSDPHSSNLAKFMPAKLTPMVPSASRASPTFVGHNFMDEPSHSPAKSAGTKAAAQLPRSALVQAVVVKRAAAEQTRAATGPLKAAKAVQAKAAFCTLSKALEGDDNVPCRLSDGCLLAGSDGCTLAARHEGLCALSGGSGGGGVTAAHVTAEAPEANLRGGKVTSQFRGVSRRVSKYGALLNRKWVARMQQHNKDVIIGHFDTELDAALAYDKARQAFGGKVMLNFPSGHPQGCCKNHRLPPSPKPPSPKPPSPKASPMASGSALALEFRPPAPSSKRKVAEVAEDYVSLPDYVACRLADGCMLAERHKGLCLIPEPEGRRNKRAAPLPPSLKKKQQKKGVVTLEGILVDEIERVGLKLAGMYTWVGGP